MALRCKFGHNHPPDPACSEITKSQVVGTYWGDYADIAVAERAGHPRAWACCLTSYSTWSLNGVVMRHLTPPNRLRTT